MGFNPYAAAFMPMNMNMPAPPATANPNTGSLENTVQGLTALAAILGAPVPAATAAPAGPGTVPTSPSVTNLTSASSPGAAPAFETIAKFPEHTIREVTLQEAFQILQKLQSVRDGSTPCWRYARMDCMLTVRCSFCAYRIWRQVKT